MNEIFGIIYKITNLINGKVYIGQTVQTFKRRKIEHLYEYRKNRVFHPIYNAMRKYGEENFNWSIIDHAYSRQELDDREIFWIDFYKSYVKRKDNNGYNLTIGGGALSGEYNPMYGREVSEETREKLRIANTGKNNHKTTTDEQETDIINLYLEGLTMTDVGEIVGVTYTVVSRVLTDHKIDKRETNRKGDENGMFGKNHSDDAKKKISEKLKGNKNMVGKKRSEETKRKISESRKGRYAGENSPMYGKRGADNAWSKPVVQLSKYGEFIAEHVSAKYAGDSIGKTGANITKCCKGELKTAYGFKWVYAEDYAS